MDSVIPVVLAGTRRTRATSGMATARANSSAPAAPSQGLAANPAVQMTACQIHEAVR